MSAFMKKTTIAAVAAVCISQYGENQVNAIMLSKKTGDSGDAPLSEINVNSQQDGAKVVKTAEAAHQVPTDVTVGAAEKREQERAQLSAERANVKAELARLREAQAARDEEIAALKAVKREATEKEGRKNMETMYNHGKNQVMAGVNKSIATELNARLARNGAFALKKAEECINEANDKLDLIKLEAEMGDHDEITAARSDEITAEIGKLESLILTCQAEKAAALDEKTTAFDLVAEVQKKVANPVLPADVSNDISNGVESQAIRHEVEGKPDYSDYVAHEVHQHKRNLKLIALRELKSAMDQVRMAENFEQETNADYLQIKGFLPGEFRLSEIINSVEKMNELQKLFAELATTDDDSKKVAVEALIKKVFADAADEKNAADAELAAARRELRNSFPNVNGGIRRNLHYHVIGAAVKFGKRETQRANLSEYQQMVTKQQQEQESKFRTGFRTEMDGVMSEIEGAAATMQDKVNAKFGDGEYDPMPAIEEEKQKRAEDAANLAAEQLATEQNRLAEEEAKLAEEESKLAQETETKNAEKEAKLAEEEAEKAAQRKEMDDMKTMLANQNGVLAQLKDKLFAKEKEAPVARIVNVAAPVSLRGSAQEKESVTTAEENSSDESEESSSGSCGCI